MRETFHLVPLSHAKKTRWSCRLATQNVSNAESYLLTILLSEVSEAVLCIHYVCCTSQEGTEHVFVRVSLHAVRLFSLFTKILIRSSVSRIVYVSTRFWLHCQHFYAPFARCPMLLVCLRERETFASKMRLFSILFLFYEHGQSRQYVNAEMCCIESHSLNRWALIACNSQNDWIPVWAASVTDHTWYVKRTVDTEVNIISYMHVRNAQSKTSSHWRWVSFPLLCPVRAHRRQKIWNDDNAPYYCYRQMRLD